MQTASGMLPALWVQRVRAGLLPVDMEVQAVCCVACSRPGRRQGGRPAVCPCERADGMPNPNPTLQLRAMLRDFCLAYNQARHRAAAEGLEAHRRPALMPHQAARRRRPHRLHRRPHQRPRHHPAHRPPAAAAAAAPASAATHAAALQLRLRPLLRPLLRPPAAP